MKYNPMLIVAGLMACHPDLADIEMTEPEVSQVSSSLRPHRSRIVTHQRTVYADGLHNENTELLRLADGRLLLAFRGGEMGQAGSANARIKIFESSDDLATPCPGRRCWLLAEVRMPDDPNDPDDDRDIRDPKLVEFGGRLFLYAISRVPGFGFRDLLGQAWTVRSESLDGGRTWTAPVKTLEDRVHGVEEFWGGWRFIKRTFRRAGDRRERLYMTAYNDGDTAVGWFSSDDGRVWTKRGEILRDADRVPSEAEAIFFGVNQRRAVALIRADDEGVQTDGHTDVCYGRAPAGDAVHLAWRWTCSYRLDQRLDGPGTLVLGAGQHRRVFVAARKHLPCTFKRTALYELRGLFNPRTPPRVCEIQTVNGIGDTAYAAWAPMNGGTRGQFLLTWYSSWADFPWLEGQFTPSDIRAANVDLTKAPRRCTPPPPESSCRSAPLPPSEPRPADGQYLLTVQTVHWSGLSGIPNFAFFDATIATGADGFELTLQPLDQATIFDPDGPTSVGAPIEPQALVQTPDGRFTATFGDVSLPGAVFPILGADLPLNLRDLVLTGSTLDNGVFCGGLDSFAQVLPGPSDILLLQGSRYAAVPWLDVTPGVFVSGCP